MKIIVKNFVRFCDTADEGQKIFEIINRSLQNDENVVVSFANCTSATSSFVNSALLPVLDLMTLNEFKSRIQIDHCNKQVATMIRRRVSQMSVMLESA